MKKGIILIFCLPFVIWAQAVLPTSWSFVNPSPTGASSSNPSAPPIFYPTKAGWSTKLDAVVTGSTPFTYATGADGTAAGRLDGQDEYVQIEFAEKPGLLTYQVRGTGINPNPAFQGAFTVQQSTNGTTWTNLRVFSDTAVGSTTMTGSFGPTSTPIVFTDTPSTAARFIRFYYSVKKSGSNVALDNITLNLPPAPPFGLAVRRGATALANGATTIIGNTTTTPFTIANIGISQVLQIDSVRITGANASDFTFAVNTDTVAANTSKVANLSFTPGSTGSRFATMTFYSNDIERSPFVVNLYAIGGNFATEPTQVATISLQNVRTHAMDIVYTRVPSAERYLVLRKTGSTLTEQPTDGVTYRRGDTIGGAQVAYIGSDTFPVKPTYILANTSYSYRVFSCSGPAGFENYNTTAAPFATVTTPGNSPDNYYMTVNPNSPSFISALNTRLKTPQDTVFYGNFAATHINNFLTRDTTGGRRVVNCVYTGIAYVYDEPFLWWGNTGTGTLTREHTFAQSWMPSNALLGPSWPEVNGREVLEYNDQHNLFPAHQLNANARRSNNPFGVVVNATYTSPTGFGKLGTDSAGTTVYEPKDDQKGDLARALFYMLVRYNGDRGLNWRLPSSQNIALLLKWHQEDPPSPLEIARNEYIFSIQKNRNPFIDNPTWVNRINFSNLTYVPDSSQKFVVINSPNGGETFNAGANVSISWSTANIDTVRIEYLRNGNWILISDTTPASRNLITWTVPTINASGLLMRITQKSNSLIGDTSNSSFSISIPGIITVLTPNGGETFTAGNPISITWTSSNVDTVRIQYRTGGTWVLISDTTPASRGSLAWNAPNINSNSVFIRILQKTNLTRGDTSNSFFSIRIPSIRVGSPNGGENFIAGQRRNISWFASAIDTVKIELLSNGVWVLISDTTPASRNSIVWTVPAINTNAALIRISHKSNSALMDSSNAPFSIITRSIILTYPNGGEVISVGTPGMYTLATWSSANIDSVTVELWVQDTLYKRFGNVSAMLPIFSVSHSDLGVKTTKAKVKVISNVDSSLHATSTNYFTIDYTIGLKELLEASEVLVYPNPSSGIITIALQNNIKESFITVYDATGKIVLQNHGLDSIELTSKGIYLIQIQTEKGMALKKVIIN